MSEELYKEFVVNVVRNLERNGYPASRVSLPLERMYEVAHQKGLNFNKALEQLRDGGIDHEKTTDKVIFFPVAVPPDMFSPDMLAKAAEMLQNMTPEQRRQVEELYNGMSEEERNELLRKAQELGMRGNGI